MLLVDALPTRPAATSALAANSFARSAFGAYSQYLPSRVIVYFLIQLYFADALQSNWIQVALVYNRLGYHWATTTTASTSLLALLTLVMLLCFLLYQFSRHCASNI